VLGWQPQVTFQELVKMMVDSDLALLRQQMHDKRDPRPHVAKVA
jgi:hypothetical protein